MAEVSEIEGMGLDPGVGARCTYEGSRCIMTYRCIRGISTVTIDGFSLSSLRER